MTIWMIIGRRTYLSTYICVQISPYIYIYIYIYNNTAVTRILNMPSTVFSQIYKISPIAMACPFLCVYLCLF